MYEKPELTLVGHASALVLGPVIQGDDSDEATLRQPEGLPMGLDD